MKALISTGLAICVAIPIVLMGQWPDYPTRGVPRNDKGEPVMDGPTPRTADGHPDFSGVWTLRAGGGGQLKGKDGKGPPPDGKGPPPDGKGPPPGQFAKGKGKGDGLPPPSEGPPVASFRSVGQNFKGGLPLKPAAKALVEARDAEHSKDNPDAHCLPLGLMQLHEHPQPRKIIQTPGLIVMLYEAQASIRQIFMDGRPLPKDVLPWWYGYSVGHWDGDTLVVETTGFRDDVWLDIIGNPLTETGKMTERLRRPNYGSLEIDVTFEDPAVYTEPFTVRVNQRIMPDTDLIEFICTENDRSGPHLVGK